LDRHAGSWGLQTVRAGFRVAWAWPQLQPLPRVAPRSCSTPFRYVLPSLLARRRRLAAAFPRARTLQPCCSLIFGSVSWWRCPASSQQLHAVVMAASLAAQPSCLPWCALAVQFLLVSGVPPPGRPCSRCRPHVSPSPTVALTSASRSLCCALVPRTTVRS
jgi:hypothetical protein